MKYERIVVASSNKGKIREISEIFEGVEVVSAEDAGFTGEIEENGETFAENAYIKASAVGKALGLPTLADDSGLCVAALGGAPGIYSARFSGEGPERNRKLLLEKMEGKKDRSAYFECAMCLWSPDAEPVYGTGRTYGKILFEETGEKGFGYDCLFYSDDLQKSFGEAEADEKNAVSHRGRALQDLKSKL